MKKATFIITLIQFLPIVFIFMLLFILMMGGGDSDSTSAPIVPPCSEEKAEEYAMVASEMGVSWSLVLLADIFNIEKNNKLNLEDINPLFTTLEFMVLKVTEERKEIEYVLDEDGFGVEYETWTETDTIEYIGKDEILSYAGLGTESDISVSALISACHDRAIEDATDYDRYTEEFIVNTDYEKVLIDIGIDPEDVKNIIELANERYLDYLYFDGEINYTFVDLPEVQIGEVTRMELAEIATSLIGHPYLLGGKSAFAGMPVGPLDCSGFVDWVYFQGFGKTIAKGAGTAGQFYASSEITEDELKIGDLGFYQRPEDVTGYNHVGIYIGEIGGRPAFIHCGGSGFGYPDRPKGRVGISINNFEHISNSVNPLGGTFSPPMYASKFMYFRRPQFQFVTEE